MKLSEDVPMELQKMISDLRRQLKLINKAILIFERLADRQIQAKSVSSERHSNGAEGRQAG